jgi:RNA polymerase sigma-70 factor (ECF subfamily)
MELQVYRSREAELVRECQRGDRGAQKSVYELYAGRIYSLCRRYVPDAMDAEDVLVSSFVKVFDRIGQFRGEGSFEGWIRRIAVNESLTWLRKNKSMYVETELEAAERQPDFSGLSDHLEAEDLLKMVNELPPGYRMVFNLYAIDGYTHEEIGKQLGISENTSKSQLSRARALLQKRLLESEKELNKKVQGL